ncbi:hypothetical protein DR864_05215 [Runella rosea]|uniref:HTH araC/xylS-type domain-containing protein n=1 Tax=Runella rosea TaxID=2259595 RepID=A0A344TEV5_9BACT|nr:AraC family transcriptional regulator [Runella rosea]AXE17176.1 hypothetical protein DR864_05215 [Runella rosea]
MNAENYNQMGDSFQIAIYLNVTHIDKVLPFLLHNQIAFTLSGIETPPFPIETPVDSLPNLCNETLYKPLTMSESGLIDFVYRKYIVEGVGKIPPKIEDIAEEVGISSLQFNKLIKKCFGKPFYRVYMEYKMEYAAGLLREGQTASSVSQHVGYTQPTKFNKTFQKFYGITPYRYRKSQA